MNTLTILFVLTSHASIADTGKPTGVWLEEFTTPYYAFVDAGYNVDIASVKGGAVPIDPASVSGDALNTPSVKRYMSDAALQAALKNTRAVGGIAAKDYAALFLPGGHGTMWDLPTSRDLATLIGTMLDSGDVVAAVCHGPAGLVNARLKSGESVVKGKRVAAFTNEEEAAVGLTDAVPFLLETKLETLGATISKAPMFTPHAVRDGALITGQNPASSEAVAKLVINALQESKQ